MEAQAPEGGQGGAADDAGQLLHHLGGAWTHENVEINHPSCHSPAQRILSNDHLHGIAVEQQNTMTAAICATRNISQIWSTAW